MSTRKSQIFPQTSNEEVIHVQRMETIATIAPSDQGEMTMVVAAFRAVGEYLDMRVGRDGEPDELVFDYRGWRFRARADEPPAQDRPVPFRHPLERPEED